MRADCSLYARKRTFAVQIDMSAKCLEPTLFVEGIEQSGLICSGGGGAASPRLATNTHHSARVCLDYASLCYRDTQAPGLAEMGSRSALALPHPTLPVAGA